MGDEPRLQPPRPGTPQQQLAAVVAGAVQQGLAPITARIAAMEDESERVSQILTGLLGQLGMRAEQQGGEEVDEARAPCKDTIWACKKCGTRLGMYDADADVMRLRHKEFIVHAHAGIGGWVRVLCRGCAELNVVEYATALAEQVNGLHELAVVGDKMELDEPLLLHLLEVVRENHGQLKIRLVQAPQPSPL